MCIYPNDIINISSYIQHFQQVVYSEEWANVLTKDAVDNLPQLRHDHSERDIVLCCQVSSQYKGTMHKYLDDNRNPKIKMLWKSFTTILKKMYSCQKFKCRSNINIHHSRIVTVKHTC